MSICKIGETKVINGKRYRKEASRDPERCCTGCAFKRDIYCDLSIGKENVAIETGGRECSGTIWILADDQPDAPTATPPRDEVREERRFRAAVAAMQGIIASGRPLPQTKEMLAAICFDYADALISEMEKPESER